MMTSRTMLSTYYTYFENILLYAADRYCFIDVVMREYIFKPQCLISWNKHPNWTTERKCPSHLPPIIMYCTLLFNGANNSVTDSLNSPSCYQLLLYFQSVKLTSWSVSWIQLSDCVQLKTAKSCKCACLEFSFVMDRKGMRIKRCY